MACCNSHGIDSLLHISSLDIVPQRRGPHIAKYAIAKSNLATSSREEWPIYLCRPKVDRSRYAKILQARDFEANCNTTLTPLTYSKRTPSRRDMYILNI